MPRLTAQRRLSMMSRAVSLAEDRAAIGQSSIPLSDIAETLGESVEDIRESLEPLIWVEFEVPGGIVDLLDAVRVEDDHLTVEYGWWRSLANLSPPEAARLYVKAASAASLESEAAMPLQTAMRKLRGIVGQISVIEDSPSKTIADLRRASGAGDEVIVNIEGHDRTLVTAASRFFVLAVFRDNDAWKVTLQSTDAGLGSETLPGWVGTIPVDRIVAVIPASSDAPKPESAPSTIDAGPDLTVTLEYPANRDWVLDALETTDFSRVGDERIRCTIRSWGTAELKTLLLRLGPEANVIDPPELNGLQTSAASEILALYSES